MPSTSGNASRVSQGMRVLPTMAHSPTLGNGGAPSHLNFGEASPLVGGGSAAAAYAGDQLSSPSSAAILLGFPTTIPVSFMTEDEKTKPYGIGDRASKELRRGIKAFVTWSSTAIQLDRSERYAAAVQTTTTEKQETTILSYMGYLSNFVLDVSADQLLITAYASPHWFAQFISFLQAREVGRGHIIKHMSLARKVNNYLVSGGSAKAWVGVVKASAIMVFGGKGRVYVYYRLDAIYCMRDLGGCLP